jgi:hypothetical protein
MTPTLRWLRSTSLRLADEGRTKQNERDFRHFTTKRGKSLDAFALSPEIGQ